MNSVSSVTNVSKVSSVSSVSKVSSIKDGATSISDSIFRYLVFPIILWLVSCWYHMGEIDA